MRGIFNPENSFWEFATNITNLLAISILWILCCIPVFSVGVSTTAMFSYSIKLAKNTEGYVIRTFFQEWKKNFWKATLLWIIFLILGGFLFVDAYILWSIGTYFSNIIFFMLMAISILYLLTGIYVFPVLAYYKESIADVLKRSFILSIGNLPISFVIVLIYTFAGWVIVKKPITIVFIGGFAIYLSSFFFNHVFSKFDGKHIDK